MCPNLNISGKCPISNILLNILYKGKEIGVANKAINFPGTPQCDELDFFISRHNLATSIGDVLMLSSLSKMSSLGGKFGAGSWAFLTEDFEEKKLLKMSAFCCGSVITWSFSIIGGIQNILLFFINFVKMENFFLAEMW